MLRVGLTGGIGSGKTFIASRLRELGCYVINADKIGHDVLTIPHISYFQTVAAFGTDILAADYSIDRSKLASIVFTDSAQLAKLDAIVHPEVARIVEERLACVNPEIFVYEVAVLFEYQMEKQFDVIVAADCPISIRIDRAMKRDGVTKEQIMRRISRQLSLVYNQDKISYLINTDQTPENTLSDVDSLYQRLLASL